MAGFIVISMSHATYNGSDADYDAFELRDWPLYEPKTEENQSHQQRHLEPISGVSFGASLGLYNTADLL
jgi:hypothetical protein